MTIDAILEHVDQNLPQATERLLELLKIPSISTDPAYKTHCDEAADWLVAELNALGFQAEKRSTSGHPMVVAHGGEGEFHSLFYGHYDVQPVDPLELWDRDPFDPEVQDTPHGPVIRARGASDDKGQLMTFVEACRAWKAVTGKLPGKLTIFFEGEEESGSPSLVPFMRENREELTADIAFICDTGLFDEGTPGIITQLRGMVSQEVVIEGPNKDLHSGFYGGPAINPARVLCKVIAELHDEHGRVTVPGFYEGVPELTPDQAKSWENLGFSSTNFLGDVGLSEPAGEEGRTALEMIWSQPTCEVNGLIGGYTGDGFKTVIPSQARAKISFRLVGQQNPEQISKAFQAFVGQMLPADCTAQFIEHGSNPASQMSTDHPVFALAKTALSDEWPNEAAFIGCGGSIPISGHFQNILNMDTLLMGFAKEDDQIHSPNEKYDVRSFHKGIRSWVRLFDQLPD